MKSVTIKVPVLQKNDITKAAKAAAKGTRKLRLLVSEVIKPKDAEVLQDESISNHNRNVEAEIAKLHKAIDKLKSQKSTPIRTENIGTAQ